MPSRHGSTRVPWWEVGGSIGALVVLAITLVGMVVEGRTSYSHIAIAGICLVLIGAELIYGLVQRASS